MYICRFSESSRRFSCLQNWRPRSNCTSIIVQVSASRPRGDVHISGKLPRALIPVRERDIYIYREREAFVTFVFHGSEISRVTRGQMVRINRAAAAQFIARAVLAISSQGASERARARSTMDSPRGGNRRDC